jgi:hypothetical protein
MHTLVITNDPSTKVVTTLGEVQPEPVKPKINLFTFGFICISIGCVVGMTTVISLDAIAGESLGVKLAETFIETR